MSNVRFFLTSSLEKVFLLGTPAAMAEGACLSTWRGAHASVQLVAHVPLEKANPGGEQVYDIAVEGAPCAASVLGVEHVPSQFPSFLHARLDDNYITHDPGLFPDALSPLHDAKLRPIAGQYRALWLRFDIPQDAKPGTYAVTVRACAPDGEAHACHFALRVCEAKLPEQELIHTEWFHADCLANYYHVKPWSEAHFGIVEKFIAAAARHGINMLLTPIFTPPLDTQVGGERLTVQLVDIHLEKGVYSFSWDKLARWVQICKRNGIAYLEIAHLYTQWGAFAAPKIMACVDGEERRLFGWDTKATSPEYRAFLEALLPALQKALEQMGYDREHVYYHISDEPTQEHLETYRAAKEQVEALLRGCPVIDALSSLDFYQQGLVARPVPANDHIQPFIEAGVPDLWVYYCCGQCVDVPNRFFSMPSARNRIMGVLMYLYDIKGFLQWGFNFYNTQYSIKAIDPYRVTDSGCAFPSGDAFLVYPGEDGEAITSIRAQVQDEALEDMRALKALDARIGREAVEALIYEHASMRPMTFKSYPKDAEYLLALREAVAERLDAAQGK